MAVENCHDTMTTVLLWSTVGWANNEVEEKAEGWKVSMFGTKVVILHASIPASRTLSRQANLPQLDISIKNYN